jgi:hypothetical protein
MPLDITTTIISEYANSPAICSSIDSEFQAIDPTALINDWYDDIWNVQTAVGYGLDVWGRIVGVSRVLNITTDLYVGWQEAADITTDSWGNAIWSNGSIPATSNYALSDSAFRTLIYAKALANISDCSITSINNILMTLFGPTPLGFTSDFTSDFGSNVECWVQDNLNMTITLMFSFQPTLVDLAIIQTSGVIPRPAGVTMLYSFGAALP